MMNAQYGYPAKPSRPKGRHSCWRITVILVVFFIYLATIVLASLNSIPRDIIGDLGGLFVNQPRLGSMKFLRTPDPITHALIPPIWVYWAVWPLQYFWNLLWMFYGISTIWRRGYLGSYLYREPCYMPMWLYFGFFMANLCGSGWLILWDRGYIWISLIPLAFEAFFCIVGLAASLYALYKYKQDLIDLDRKAEVGWTIALVHNGLGMYTAWACVDTLIQLATVLYMEGMLQLETSYYVSLSILSTEVMLWFILDNFVFWRGTRYLFTPYIVVCLTLAGICVEHWAWPEPYTIFSIVLLGFSGFFLLMKLVISCARTDRKKQMKRQLEHEGGFDPVVVDPAPQGYIIQQPDMNPLYRPTKSITGGRYY